MTKKEYLLRYLSKLSGPIEFKPIKKKSYSSPEETIKRLAPSLWRK
jgi:hypothetical protein